MYCKIIGNKAISSIDIISIEEFHSLCNQPNITVLESDRHGAKVFETNQGNIIKLFRYQKKWLSSNYYCPYALRFCKNAKRLLHLDVQAPVVKTAQYCRELNTFVICYQKMVGTNVLSLVKQGQTSILPHTLKYIANLHQKGIFFRAIHLSNILYKTDGSFALLDVADVKFKKKPLSFYMRYRNFKHLFLHEKDKNLWKSLDISYYLQSYYQSAKLSFFSQKILAFLIQHKILVELKSIK